MRTTTEKYPQGYTPKIEYWIGQLNNTTDANQRLYILEKLNYFTKKQAELDGKKKLDLDQMMDLLENKYNLRHVRSTEYFHGTNDENKYGIWLSGEDREELDGQVIFDYWTMNYKDYENGVLIKFKNQINELGWYPSWNDAGTIMLYEI